MENGKRAGLDGKKHEIRAVAVFVATLLVLFSLVSFHASDLTFFNASAMTRPTVNWVGGLGAHLAWSLFFLFGLGAYGLPLVGFHVGLASLRGRPVLAQGPYQVIGMVLLLLGVVSLLGIHTPTLRMADGHVPWGGVIGSYLARVIMNRLHAVGGHVLLAGMLLIGLLLATPLTLKSLWDWICRRIGAVGAFSLWLAGLIGRIRLWRKKKPAAVPTPVKATPVKGGKVKEISPARILPAPSPPTGRKRIDGKNPQQLALPKPGGHYALPSPELLDVYEGGIGAPDWKQLEANALVLQEKLADFGVQGKVMAISPGPVITMYEYAPAPGIKISRIVGLSDDLSMALKAESIRVVAPIPGKAAIGVEIPNASRELVSARAIMESEAFVTSQFPLTIALGKDITGQPVVANLAKMPHLLIAGATGTGKSVCINTVLSSLLFRNTPEDLRLLLIDPKRIELSSYEGVPQLIHPVVTDAKMATRALRWAVQEMELRYKLLADKNARNIEGYNKTLAREKPKKDKGEEGAGSDAGTAPTAMDGDAELKHHRLPYLVIVIDELADLMMVASREVEESITRLAQMARAAGIHLILATQRPSVDVLTGIIKANIPTRISFQVSSKIDSRTILDGMGAESLLGMGDMLFLPPGTAKIQRIHGAFVSDAEVLRLTEFWRAQKTVEDPMVERVNFEDQGNGNGEEDGETDEKYDEAVELVLETRQASISMIQRRLRVGYNRAARMIEAMEQQGIVSASDGVRPREVIGRRN